MAPQRGPEGHVGALLRRLNSMDGREVVKLKASAFMLEMQQLASLTPFKVGHTQLFRTVSSVRSLAADASANGACRVPRS
mmetsp:Transcript_24137/g.54920  ORF Transcript_24137/g.54920 Transcript_24137/m.54920 type:complete len:80 (+) Transcript_24137:966-1205(+)